MKQVKQSFEDSTLHLCDNKSSYNIAPKHLNDKAFINMIRYFRDTRVKCKHIKDDKT